MFEPGQKVICVNDTFPEGIFRFYTSLPNKGDTYTVRDIVPGQDWQQKETVTVYLVELVNPIGEESIPGAGGLERGFACWRFAEAEEVTEQATTKESVYA